MASKPEKTESIDLSDVSKQIAQMLAEAREEARKEAEKIIAEAKAKANGEKSEEEKKAAEERAAYWNELVPIKLFRDNGKYKDDVFVSVNGENCQVQRGEEVMIKRKFKNLLDLSDLQDYETSKLIDKKSREFSAMDM